MSLQQHVESKTLKSNICLFAISCKGPW